LLRDLLEWMASMLIRLKQFVADQSGATAIEYALIAVLVGIAIIGAVTALGDSLQAIFSSVATQLDSVSS
jgi:pilus assembly protein Flp/PilA